MAKIRQNMHEYMDTFEETYSDKNIKFRMSESADAFFIIFGADNKEGSYSSSTNSALSEIA